MRKTDGKGNLTISSFFAPKPRTDSSTPATSSSPAKEQTSSAKASNSSSNFKRRASSPIQVPDDSDEDANTGKSSGKKPKLDDAAAQPASSAAAATSGSASTSAATSSDKTPARPSRDKLARFQHSDMPSAATLDQQTDEPADTSATGAQAAAAAAAAKRHQAFRKRLIGNSSVLLRKGSAYLSTSTREEYDDPQRILDPSFTSGEAAADGDEQMAEAGDGSAGSDSDVEDDDTGKAGPGPKTLSLKKFAAAPDPSGRKSLAVAPTPAASSKAKGKGKAKEKAVGPSGQTYTPLEEQILELKDKYPGVLLVVEVGYKFRFFGEDARVASKHLNVACFPDRNFLSAMIPVHRLHVHIRTLISVGYKVGVVRQTETRALKAISSNASKPFTRDLSAIYTASTWVDDLSLQSVVGDKAGGEALPSDLASHTLVALMEKSDGGPGGLGDRVTIGIVSVQVSTGQIIYDQFSDTGMRSELETRLAHMSPIELLLPPKGKLSRLTEKVLKHTANRGTSDGQSIRIERLAAADVLEYNSALDLANVTIHEAQGVDEATKAATLSKLGALPNMALIAFATCMAHLRAFGLVTLFQRSFNLASFESRSTMLLAANTLANLEILRNNTDQKEHGSLLWLVDRCQTAMGKRLLRKWITQPLRDVKALRARCEAVEEVAAKEATSPTLAKALGLLQGTPDLEKGHARLSYGRSSPSELATVLTSLSTITNEFTFAAPEEVPASSSVLREVLFSLSAAREICHAALAAISVSAAKEDSKADLFVDPELFPSVQDVKDLLSINEQDFKEHLKEVRKQLKRPALQYVKVADKEYLIEVPKDEAKRLPSTWLRISEWTGARADELTILWAHLLTCPLSSDSTTKVVRFHTPRIIELMKQRDQLLEKLAIEANEAFDEFVRRFIRNYIPLRNVVTSMATLDAIRSLARLGTLPGWTRPAIVEVEDGNVAAPSGAGLLSLTGFRHPMSEALLNTSSTGYVPNDLTIGGETGVKGILLTGSNMGGKSSLVRAVALCVILAQLGACVPADEACLTVHDAVLTRMGASDDLARNRSTFRVEVEETAEILRTATGRSLVILDELGRGTSTNDGTAVAYAVLHHLMTRPLPRCPSLLFITHYFTLGSVAADPKLDGRLRNMHMAYSEAVDEETQRKQVVFLHKLREGLASSSFGIHCAELAGLPKALTERAAEEAGALQRQTEQKRAEKRRRLLAGVVRGVFGAPQLEGDENAEDGGPAEAALAVLNRVSEAAQTAL